MELIGDNLRLARQRAGKTQRFIARLCGVSPTTYSSYERNKMTPKADFIQDFCKILDINPSWILLNQGTIHLSGSGLRINLLEKIMVSLEKHLEGAYLSVDMQAQARIVSIVYGMCEDAVSAGKLEQFDIDRQVKRLVDLAV